MILDAPPLIPRIRRHANIGFTASIRTKACRTASRLIHIARLSIDGNPIRLLVLNTPHKPVGKLNPLRMLLCGGGGVDPGGKHFPAHLILNGSFHHHRHIVGRRIMVFIIYSNAVCKMRGLRQPQFLKLLIHQLHKRFLRACHIDGQPQGCIRSGRQYGTVHQIPYGDCLIPAKARITAFMLKAVVCDVYGDGKCIIPVLNMLRRNQGGQHLGHRCRNHPAKSILGSKNLSALCICKNNITAGNILPQLPHILCRFIF